MQLPSSHFGGVNGHLQTTDHRPLGGRYAPGSQNRYQAYFRHTFRPPEARSRLSLGRHISGPLAFETVPSGAKLVYSLRSIYLVEVPGGSYWATLVPYLVVVRAGHDVDVLVLWQRG